METKKQVDARRIEHARDLERRFAKVLAAYRRHRVTNPLARPFYVESFGLPKSFKTTFSNTAEHFLKREGWKIFAPPEGPEVLPVFYGRTPRYNDETFRYALRLMEQYRESPLEMLLLERAVFDHVTWLEYWTRKGDMTAADRQRGEEYALQPRLRSEFDAHICFVADPQVALEREVANTLSSHVGETMNPATMEQLLDIHKQVFDRFKAADDPKMLWIDTSHMEVKDVALVGLEHICKRFEARAKTFK